MGIFQLMQIPSLVEPLVRILLLVVCLIQLNVLYSSRLVGLVECSCTLTTKPQLVISVASIDIE